jgi:hypothetical protein
MSSAVFPKSIVPWVDRIDQVNVVYAADPNSLAAEVIAIENTIGVMPQVEKAPYVGNSVTYSTVDARMSDILAGNLHPYTELSTQNFYCNNDERWFGNWGHGNFYNRVYDSHGFYNGTDITVGVSGLYLVTAQQTWEWHDSGFCFHHCYIDYNWCAGHRWDWDFANAGPGYYDPTRLLTTSITYLGPITQGQRVSIVSENGTSRNPYHVISSNFRIYCLRKLPQSALNT